jgi:EAL domain-containing protein (putative c-di-GMP-specific phosphodiesterase class I)/ActR/RegA family two-component response regulator
MGFGRGLTTGPDGRKGMILVVDDEPSLREILSEILGEAGYHVETAANGKEAIVLLEGKEWDAVLSDVNMPDVNGLGFLRAVRERDLDVPVILMSGAPDLQTSMEAIEYGAFRFLSKPLRPADLTASIDSAVRMHRLARVKRDALTHLGLGEKLVGDRAGLEASFARALQAIWMSYQPIVRASDRSVFSYEALVRSRDEVMPHPGALFGAAERLNRVHELGRAIRRSVAVDMEAADGLTVFVNVHSQELADEALFTPTQGLSRYARSVVLEITERASLEGVPDVRARIAALRRLGYRIAVDDLGAGYAGLTTFAALEPDIVKLDMALVRGVDREVIKRRLVSSMVTVSKESGVLVVAEGVETAAEATVLADLGCDLLQGYLYGRPGPGLGTAASTAAPA